VRKTEDRSKNGDELWDKSAGIVGKFLWKIRWSLEVLLCTWYLPIRETCMVQSIHSWY